MELDMVRVLLSVAIMAGVTYLLRMLPVTVFQKKNRKPVYTLVSLLCPLRGARRHDGARDILIDRESARRHSRIYRRADTRLV